MQARVPRRGDGTAVRPYVHTTGRLGSVTNRERICPGTYAIIDAREAK